MKHEERVTALKNQRARPAHSTGERLAWLPPWAKVVLTVAVSAAITYWLCENVLLSRVPTAMLGKWQVTEGELMGTKMEFFRDGTVHNHIVTDGHLNLFVSSVRAKDDMLETTFYPDFGGPRSLWERIVYVFMPDSGTKITVDKRIMKLTPMELVIEDADGTLIRMTRVN